MGRASQPFQALVVDNNPVLLKAIAVIVEQEGRCQVRTAEDGLQALETLKSFKPDVIFTDLVMPLVDGELLCKIVRHNKDLKDICMVLVSAVPVEQTRYLLDAKECDFCIVKGTLTELRSHIREIFRVIQKKTYKTNKNVMTPPPGKTKNLGDQSITTEILNEKKHRKEIVAYLSEGVVEMNYQGKIVEINKAASDILELQKEQVIGTTIDSLNWGMYSKSITDWQRTDLFGKRSKPLFITEKQPVFRQEKVLTATFLAIDGSSYFGICIVKDITRLYRAEEYNRKLDDALRLIRKMEAMSDMAGGVAHDFNNLLTIICGNIDMASTALEEGEPAKVEYMLDIAQRSAQGAVALTTKISHFSPYGIINREKHEVKWLVDRAITTFHPNRPTEFLLDLSDDTLHINIDHEQMTTSLHNLFTNCLESSDDTDIAIRARKLSLDQPLVEHGKYVPAGSYVQLSVSDTGRGIEEMDIIEIFDPYFSTKKRGNEKGMGLGLAVVYSTVRNHGGYVTVESQVGQGTTVTFYVPLATEAFNDGTFVSGNHIPMMPRILLVEEDRQSRRVAQVMLEHLGLDVEGVSKREEALKMYAIRRGEDTPFSAVMINLPAEDPDSAFETCQEIKRMNNDVPVIAVCGASILPAMKNFGPAGFVNLLQKPYTIDELRNILSSVMGSC